MVYQVFITKNNGQTYMLTNFNDISFAKNTPVSPMPLPEEDSEDNMLMKIEGNSTTLQIGWTLINQPAGNVAGGSDISYDSATSKWKITDPTTEIKTVFEQIIFLEKFVPNSLNDYYIIYFYDSELPNVGIDKKHIYQKEGLFQGINFRTDSGSPVNWTVALDFIEGTTITTLGGNTHEAGTVTSATYYTPSGSRAGFTLSYKEFLNYAANDRPITKGVVLRYKRNDGVPDFWREKEIDLTANTVSPYSYTNNFLVSGLDVDLDYAVKIAFLTDGGRGEWSAEKSVV